MHISTYFILDLVTIFVLIHFNPTGGYEDGAPRSSCKSLKPTHQESDPQTTECPYRIEVTKPKHGKNVLTVKLVGAYQGFLIQARDEDDDVLGAFSGVPKHTRTMHCRPNAMSDIRQENTFIHADKSDKYDVMAQWIAPAGYSGPVIFTGSIAKDRETFWVDISSRIDYPLEETDATNPAQNDNPNSTDDRSSAGQDQVIGDGTKDTSTSDTLRSQDTTDEL